MKRLTMHNGDVVDRDATDEDVDEAVSDLEDEEGDG